MQRQTLLLSPRHSLSSQCARAHCILITNKVASQETKALLATADIGGLTLVLADNLCDILEACQAVVALHAVCVSNRLNHLRSYDSLDNELLAIEFTQLAPASQHIAEQQHHRLVTVEQNILALIVQNCDCDTVSIGVGCDYQLCTLLTSQLDSHTHRSTLLGVGRRNSGEVAIDYALLLDHNNIGKAEVAQRRGNQLHTCTVHRRIDDLHIVVLCNCLGSHRQTLNACQIDFVELLTQNGDILGVLTKLDLVDRGDLLNLSNDILVVRGSYLRTISPICLVAIVLLGIVRRRYNNTALAPQLTNCEAQLGGRTQFVEQINLEAIRCENVGNTLSKEARVVTRVVRYGNLHLLTLEALLQVVRQALSSHTDSIFVHTVRTHAHNAAQTARTELQVFIEALGQLLSIVVNQILNLRFGSLIVITFEPLLRFTHNELFEIVVHNVISFIYSLRFIEAKNII